MPLVKPLWKTWFIYLFFFFYIREELVQWGNKRLPHCSLKSEWTCWIDKNSKGRISILLMLGLSRVPLSRIHNSLSSIHYYSKIREKERETLMYILILKFCGSKCTFSKKMDDDVTSQMEAFGTRLTPNTNLSYLTKLCEKEKKEGKILDQPSTFIIHNYFSSDFQMLKSN